MSSIVFGIACGVAAMHLYDYSPILGIAFIGILLGMLGVLIWMLLRLR